MPFESKIISPGDLASSLDKIQERVEELSKEDHQIKISCPECGSGTFKYDDEKGGEGHLWCEQCGYDLGPRAEVLRNAAIKAATEKLRDAFKS